MNDCAPLNLAKASDKQVQSYLDCLRAPAAGEVDATSYWWIAVIIVLAALVCWWLKRR